MAAIDIVTEAQARDFLGISRSSAEWDLAFKGGDGYPSLITIASGRIEDYLQNKVAPQTVTDYLLDGSGTSELELPYYPIIQIAGTGTGTTPNTPDKSKLQYRGSVASGWSNLFSSQTDFDNYLSIDGIYNYKLCILESFQTFPSTGYGYKNIKVSWVAGYSTIPGEITVCCLEMIGDMRKQFAMSSDSTNATMGSNRLGLSTEGFGGMTYTYLDMNERWKKMLAPYRKLAP